MVFIADRKQMLGAALLSEGAFAARLHSPPRQGWDDNHDGYLNALVVRVHGLVLAFASRGGSPPDTR